MKPDYDVVVIGAGLSGIDAGYRLQTLCPEKTYTILEARDAIGGTWDLFRYPGIRSDSDPYTLGFPFKPWTDRKALADGEMILDYIRQTAEEFGIDDHIQYNSRVVSADFDTHTAQWTLTLADDRTVTCAFLFACSGYYDYGRGYDAQLPGLDQFDGQVVHPQFWPPDLDYDGKRIVVVGSGATAITLVPALARTGAGHVTMLQRSPTWVGVLPGTDRVANGLRKWLPPRVAHRVIRSKNIAIQSGMYQFARHYPDRARAFFTKMATKHLNDPAVVEHAFSPEYDVWDQRVCAIPDADLFEEINAGRADVVTATIETFVPEGVRLADGRTLEADIVVTATGLELQAFGGATLRVDGREVVLNDEFVFLGAMLTGVPNFAVAVGYSNASWTLRADLSARLVCKVLEYMDSCGYRWVVPEPGGPLEQRPLMDLRSGYIMRSEHKFPQQGPSSPWRMRQNYLLDVTTTLRTDLSKYLRTDSRALV